MMSLTLDKVTLRGPKTIKPRKRALRRLEKVDPKLPGSPSEVLVVRNLPDPAPGKLAQIGNAKALSTWETAAASSLSALRERAKRLSPGDTGAMAEAVLFVDEAQMIACLVERLAAGQAPGWWARALMRRLPPGASTGGVLLQQPHLVLPVIAVLIARGNAAAVFADLSEPEIAALSETIGLPVKSPQSLTPAHQMPAISEHPEKARLISVPVALETALRRLDARPALLLVAAYLRQRQRDITPKRLAQTAQLIAAKFTTDTPHTPDTPASHAQPDLAPNLNATAKKPGAPNPRPNAPSPPEHIKSQTDDTSTPEPPKEIAPKTTKAARKPVTETDNTDPPNDVLPAGTTEPDGAPDDAGIATALGGIPFLVNLYVKPISARAPELGACLDAAAQPDDGKWTALERLARALLARSDPLPDDAIWHGLRILDARPIDTAALPHKADRRAAAACETWLASAIGPAGKASTSDTRAFADLLTYPARVFVTPVHLDVVLPAQAQNLDLRRAGLDLDPGWQPRFGRIIAFHYSEQEGF
ncbi:hypothetical protein [Sedimentitalea sp.]|uniref:hypothetical protein n=1 Tax=Sedimentitalea sp. TaxID=2048915 RepID=UPI00329853CF